MTGVVGVDGSRSGWVGVVLRDGRVNRTFAATSMDRVLAASGHAEAIAIDMPIGLPDAAHGRDADRLARAYIGPRWQSVFLVPPRRVLEAARYAEAIAICADLKVGGVSQQAWALRAKIFEVERAAADDDRLFEVHPEVSFRAMAGSHLMYPKRTWNGFAERLHILRGHGIELMDVAGDLKRAGVDDVLDAAAAAWSADRWVRGVAESLPPVSEGDRRAPGRIWY